MTTQAEVVQMTEPFLNPDKIEGGGVMSLIFALVYGLMWLRKKYSADVLDVRRNAGEGDLLQVLSQERNQAMNDARQAWATRAEDAKLIGQLSTEVAGLKELNHKTNNEVALLRLVNDKNQLEIAALRTSMDQTIAQVKACATCPLRGK